MGKRFEVDGEICFVRLFTERSGPGVGLILHGENAMEAFCKEAIKAYEELLRNKERGRRLDQILNEDAIKKEPRAKKRKRKS